MNFRLCGSGISHQASAIAYFAPSLPIFSPTYILPLLLHFWKRFECIFSEQLLLPSLNLIHLRCQKHPNFSPTWISERCKISPIPADETSIESLEFHNSAMHSENFGVYVIEQPIKKLTKNLIRIYIFLCFVALCDRKIKKIRDVFEDYWQNYNSSSLTTKLSVKTALKCIWERLIFQNFPEEISENPSLDWESTNAFWKGRVWPSLEICSSSWCVLILGNFSRASEII